MHPHFETYLQTQTTLTANEISQVSSMASFRILKRNESVLFAGDICKHKTFVISGLLRNYSTSVDGSEHILRFSPENSWTLDVESYDKQAPSVINISAIEPSQVLMWNKTDFQNLLVNVPALKQLAEQLIANNTHYSSQRMLTTLSASPEEKYEDFTRRFPNLLARLPLRMIAAYLGISLKTLTRIRHAQLTR
ncbi:Crp/Fnr family transcriptional regulator [Mucilaginibacter aquatilis]|uniref:Cyclic nucleotide-binding domain-containing protein n=1 Tax=Mucilaginibacter aquatilis TaxID=1517760 RepID=A0A6I4I6R9_9SPHI|nr:Crp/Fnr family transcriptional regulator [Mucilaginibacter aquatilis]MVN90557.1 cyclic nucleotide-binding domain-containing protein [Mucilaginibacter aquatilis]